MNLEFVENLARDGRYTQMLVPCADILALLKVARLAQKVIDDFDKPGEVGYDTEADLRAALDELRKP